MTPEEKAKRYNEALEMAKIAHKDEDRHLKATLERIFPELKENKDEKIKKALINTAKYYHLKESPYLSDISKEQVISWLEKQGEQRPQGKTTLEAINEENVDNASKIVPKDYNNIDPHFGKPIDKVETKDYNNIDPHFDKPADKVEPKFHEGQWIVWQGKNFKVNYNGCGYELTDQNGKSTSLEYGAIDETANLWRIQDAKAGDVLYSPKHPVVERIVLIGGWKQLDKDCGKSLCASITYRVEEDEIEVGGVGAIWWDGKINSFYPATKEQREQLKKAMSDAGYAFDFEKKELKKIVTPKFKVGDWVVLTAGELSNTLQIVNVDTNKKLYWFNDNSYLPIVDEECLHLWTIQDAKDGDVLVHSSFMFDDFIFIYNNTSILQAYCYYSNVANRFIIEDRGHHCPWNMQEVIPATKKQRDTLMKAMADAGYTFDFEKKELKKIEDEIEIPFGAKDSELQEAIYYIPKGFHAEIDDDKVVIKKGEKPTAWSEMDKAMTRLITSDLELLKNRGYGEHGKAAYRSEIKWLKSLRYKVGCGVNYTTTKEWSEEDKTALGDALWCCKQAASIAKNENDMGNIWYAEKWLKSLEGRIHPQNTKTISQ